MVKYKNLNRGPIFGEYYAALGNKNEKLKNIIEEGAIVRGVYFNSGITEHKGKILGTLLTQNFQFYESPTSYINWIREGEIDLSLRPRKLAIPLWNYYIRLDITKRALALL